MSIAQILVQTVFSLLVHALTFFLAIQFAYVSIRSDEMRNLSVDVPVRSMLGYLTYVPLFFLSLLLPVFSLLKIVDGTDHPVIFFDATSEGSWKRYLLSISRRLLLFYLCYLIACEVLSPFVDKLAPLLAPETKRRGGDTSFIPSKKSSLIALAAVSMFVYLLRVFTLTDHLNHLVSMATSATVGVVTVLLVVGTMYTGGMLLWTSPTALTWLSIGFSAALLLLPWWILPSSAHSGPEQMIDEVLLVGKLFHEHKAWWIAGFFVYFMHFRDFFLIGETGWKATAWLPFAAKVPLVMSFLSLFAYLGKNIILSHP